MTKIIAKGKTFEAKEALKKMGFVWDAALKEWYATPSTFNKAEKAKIENAYYGRRMYEAIKHVTFENQEIEY